ncbi:MAG: hypothetical protein JWO91_2604 [Acidobacteriaceae bacterium]|nr:hypothetical protein [Acidobacteriaceae bacterium]
MPIPKAVILSLVALILSLSLSLIAQESSEPAFAQVSPRPIQGPGPRAGQRARQEPLLAGSGRIESCHGTAPLD